MRTNFIQLKASMLLCCTLMISVVTFAQQLDSRSALTLVKQNASAIGLSVNDFSNLRVSHAYFDETSKATIVYVQQTYKGVDVLNSIQTLAFRKGKLITAAGSRLDIAAIANTKDGKAAVVPADAVRTAAANLKLQVPAPVTQLKQMNEKKKLSLVSWAFHL